MHLIQGFSGTEFQNFQSLSALEIFSNEFEDFEGLLEAFRTVKEF